MDANVPVFVSDDEPGHPSEDESSPDECDNQPDWATKRLPDWAIQLQACLNGIKSRGKYGTSKRYTLFPNPGLQIGGDRLIPLPLTEADAGVIKAACRQAPFGKGTETLVDTSVRNTWELNHTEFQLVNPAWTSFLKRAAGKAADQLGLASVSVRPYKLLLYEQGSFFKRHKDSEKEPGMVGTLVISLPSWHEGGDVCLYFRTEKKTYSTAVGSAWDLCALAWFADVAHEVTVVKKGYRLVLTYNIVQVGPARQLADTSYQQKEDLRAHLGRWKAQKNSLGPLMYALDHQYTKSSLSLANMKGRDRVVCDLLSSLASDCGAFLLLAQISRSIRTADDFIMEEVTKMEFLCALDGGKMGSDIKFYNKVILMGQDMSKRRPYHEDSFTGNEAVDTTCHYRDTAAVLVPRAGVKLIIDSRHFEAIVSAVDEDLQQRRGEAMTEYASKLFTDLMDQGVQQLSNLTVMLRWALDLKCGNIIRAAISHTRNVYILQNGSRTSLPVVKVLGGLIEDKTDDLTQANTALEWDQLLGTFAADYPAPLWIKFHCQLTECLRPGPVRDSFTLWSSLMFQKQLEIFPKFNDCHYDFIIDWIQLCGTNVGWNTTWLLPELSRRCQPDLLYDLLGTVHSNRDTEPFAAMAKSSFEYLMTHSYTKLAPPGLELIFDKTGSPRKLDFADFIELLDMAYDVGAGERAIQLLGTASNLILKGASSAPDKSMVPALEMLAIFLKKREPAVPPSTKAVFELALEQNLSFEFQERPDMSLDWTRPPASCGSQQCEDCQALSQFLASENRIWRLCARPPRRKHVERVLQNAPHKVTTSRFGSPLSLVVEKTELTSDETFKRDVARIKSDLKGLKNDYVRRLLGEKAYRKLVLLQNIKPERLPIRAVGQKRPGSEAVEESGKEESGKRRK